MTQENGTRYFVLETEGSGWCVIDDWDERDEYKICYTYCKRDAVKVCRALNLAADGVKRDVIAMWNRRAEVRGEK